MTLVEVLVTITIIGILVGLLLPAVGAARESARRMVCTSHVSNLAKASLLHVEAHNFFPTGGWAGSYIGDDDRGYGRSQPGGWLFSILEYVELGTLRSLASGSTSIGESLDADIAVFLEASPSVFYCPSRRAAQPYPFIREGPGSWKVVTVPQVSELGGTTKSDYAANSGTALFHAADTAQGSMWVPSGYAEADRADASWTATDDLRSVFYQDGVMYYRSEVRPKDVTDGMSRTYMIGEKALDTRAYEDIGAVGAPAKFGDNESAWSGYEWDNHRVAWNADSVAPIEVYQPRRDAQAEGWSSVYAFGSAHPNVCLMAFCDGSVKTLSYDVDRKVHQQGATRVSAEQ